MNLHLIHDLNYPWDVSTSFDLDIHAAIQHQPSKPNYDDLRPYFLNAPANVVMHTLDATTQFACHIESGPDMYKTHHSPFPACNVRHRKEDVATDRPKRQFWPLVDFLSVPKILRVPTGLSSQFSYRRVNFLIDTSENRPTT